MRRLLQGRFAVVAVALLAGALGACSDAQQPPVVARPTMADSADQVMFGVRSAITRDGIRRGELFSDTAFVFDQNARMELRGVHVRFYTEAGVLQGTLVSREGTFNTRSGVMEARGNAVVTTEDGRQLTSPQLRYQKAEDLILSDSSFVLTTPTERVEGIGFRSDPQLRNITILRTLGGAGGSVRLPNQ